MISLLYMLQLLEFISMHSSFLTTFLSISTPLTDHLLTTKMIKMSYPEIITLLALNQFHLMASNITMAQEPAPVGTFMTPTHIAYRNNRDKAIRKNNCTFLLRIHLLPPLRQILSADVESVYAVPAVDDLPRLANFLSDDTKAQCQGRGLTCVGYEPNTLYTYVIVQGDGNGYNLVVPWRIMLLRCEVEEKGVLSMWGFYVDGMPRFIFRHDGYAGRRDELPPLTDMTVVDPEPVQDDQKEEADRFCNCCNVG